MPDISYQPAFHHTRWVNNVDRVRAGGPNGFNVRFDAIENDLRQLSTVVTQINSALVQLLGGTPPAIGPQQLNVPISFVSPNGTWFLNDSGTAQPNGLPNALALIPLSLPNHIQLQSMRAIGLFPGAPLGLTIQLNRAPLTDGAQAADVLAQITGTSPGMTNPYDQTATVDAALRSVELTTFRYFVRISATGITFSNNFQVSLHALQLTYTN
jgi:hypothetical protein